MRQELTLQSPCKIPLSLVTPNPKNMPKLEVKPEPRLTPFNRTARHQIAVCDCISALFYSMSMGDQSPNAKMCIQSILHRVKKIQRILYLGEPNPVLTQRQSVKYLATLRGISRLIKESYEESVQFDFFNGLMMLACRVLDDLEDNQKANPTTEHWKRIVSTMETICASVEDSADEDIVQRGAWVFDRIKFIIDYS